MISQQATTDGKLVFYNSHITSHQNIKNMYEVYIRKSQKKNVAYDNRINGSIYTITSILHLTAALRLRKYFLISKTKTLLVSFSEADMII